MKKTTKSKLYIVLFIIVMIFFNVFLYNYRIKNEYWETKDLIFFICLSNGSTGGIILYFSALIYIMIPSKDYVSVMQNKNIEKEYMKMSKNYKSDIEKIFISIDRIQVYNNMINDDLLNDLKNINIQDEHEKNKIIEKINALIVASNNELDNINQKICDIDTKINNQDNSENEKDL